MRNFRKLLWEYRDISKYDDYAQWAVSRTRREWLYARHYPKAADANQILAQCTGPLLACGVVSPLKTASIAEWPRLKASLVKLLIIFLLTSLPLTFIAGAFFYSVLVSGFFGKIQCFCILEVKGIYAFAISFMLILLTAVMYFYVRYFLLSKYLRTRVYFLSVVCKNLLWKIKEKLEELYILQRDRFLEKTYELFFLKHWIGCTSAGGIPATSTEQHAFSLLAVRLSMIEKATGPLLCPGSFNDSWRRTLCTYTG